MRRSDIYSGKMNSREANCDTAAAGGLDRRGATRAKAIGMNARNFALHAGPRRLFGPPSDRALALCLVAISATGSLGAMGLWAAGHGHTGLRLLSGATLLILSLLLA